MTGASTDRFGMGLSVPMDLHDCRYGTMVVLSLDNVIGKSLRLYGEWAEHELSVLRSYVDAGATVVDVGANIGTHTLPFSRWVGSGRIIAIEAQPIISNILRTNCLKNSCANVRVVNAICAERIGSLEFQYDYTKEDNYGAISFARSRGNAWRKLFRWLTRGKGPISVKVPTITLNELCGDEAVSLIKIDIEGMELDALLGADELLARCHPVIYFEQSNTRRLADTYDYLTAIGYRMFWLETHPFNQRNFRGVEENIWWRTETGIVALPGRSQPTNELIEVQRADQFPPCRLNAREGIAVSA